MDNDTFSLNIVAVPGTPKPKKEKKITGRGKYARIQRKRQRQEQQRGKENNDKKKQQEKKENDEKEEQQQQETRVGDDETTTAEDSGGNGIDNNTDTATTTNTAGDDEKKAAVGRITTTTKGRENNVSVDELWNNNENNEKEEEKKRTSSSSKGEEDDDEDQKDDDDDDDEDEAQQQQQQQQQHAEYMREFHARPYELDRRSGVASSKSTSSLLSRKKSSSHLFAEENEWTALKLHPRLLSAITGGSSGSSGSSRSTRCFGGEELRKPTNIQSKTIATFFLPRNRNSNFLIHSETGSGKTLAYALPILQSLATTTTSPTTAATSAADNDDNTKLCKVDRKKGGTRCLVLCPTRELAAQTTTVLESLCANSFGWLVTGSLLSSSSHNNNNEGGQKGRKSEKARIRKGLSIVVATPGRLLDHLTKTEALCVSLKGKLQFLVLDEADRLLDMGLGEQVRHIIQLLRANQPGSGINSDGITWRSLLVSATVTPSVEQLAKDTMLGKKEKNRSNNNNHNNNNPWIWIRGNNNRSVGSAHDDDNNNNNNNNNNDANGDDGNHSGNNNDNSGINQEQQQQLAESTPRQLVHFHVTVSAKLRLQALIAFLVERVHKRERTVVFMSTCTGVDFFYSLFRSMESVFDKQDNNNDDDSNDDDDDATGLFGRRCSIYKLHGNIPHGQRQIVMKRFCSSSNKKKKKHAAADDDDINNKKNEEASSSLSTILLATDVAARGLNLPDVDWIVQYDPPCEISDYVHRAGRVARAGKAGRSLLFLLPSERSFLDILAQQGVGSGSNKQIKGLSLMSTLNRAAQICTGATRDGLQKSGHGGASSSNISGANNNNNNDDDTDFDNNSSSSKTNNRKGEAFCLEVQRRMEECVTGNNNSSNIPNNDNNDDDNKRTAKKKKQKDKYYDNDLIELATDAFLAHIRSYPTKEKLIKHIFSTRALHLGHVAKSFALREPPKALVKKSKKNNNKNNGDNKNNNNNNGGSNNHKKRKQYVSSLAFDYESAFLLNENEDDDDNDDPKNNKGTKHNKNKRQKHGSSNHATGGGSGSAKNIMFAKATKLQTMESF